MIQEIMCIGDVEPMIGRWRGIDMSIVRPIVVQIP